MKAPVQAAVGALVLLVGGAVALRALGGARAPEAGPAERALEAPPTPASPTFPASPAQAGAHADAVGSIALRLLSLQGKSQENPSPDPAAGELLRSEEREARERLRRRLSEDPARWADLLEVLSREDPRASRKLAGELQEAVDAGAERVLIGLLKSGAHREARLASATLISCRRSKESLWALVSAAQEDSDTGVRYRALSELAVRQGRNPEEAPTISQILRIRAQVDSDPQVRRFALGASGQAAEGPSPAGPPVSGAARSH